MLDSDWISSDPIDYEYKQYKLLAYEQVLKEKIKSKSLYPVFLSLLENLKYANDFIKQINEIKNATRQPIGLDLANEKLIYKYSLTDEGVEEYLKIATFGYDIMNTIYNEFKIVYDEVEKSIEIIGERNNYLFDHVSGFLVVRYGLKTSYYKYDINQEFYPEPSHILGLHQLNEYEYHQKIFTKNVFDVFLSDEYPLDETAMPVFKRKFLRYIIS